MYSRIGTTMILLLSCLARAQTSTTSASIHPSNGVVELSVTPILEPDPRPVSERHELYGPWRGLVEIGIRNVSQGIVHLIETAAESEFTVEVLDSTGKPVAPTERGRRITEGVAHPSPFSGAFGFVSPVELVPLHETTLKMDISRLFQLEPARTYRVTIRRSKGLPQTDEGGKPLKQVEVSCSIEIPDVGILR